MWPGHSLFHHRGRRTKTDLFCSPEEYRHCGCNKILSLESQHQQRRQRLMNDGWMDGWDCVMVIYKEWGAAREAGQVRYPQLSLSLSTGVFKSKTRQAMRPKRQRERERDRKREAQPIRGLALRSLYLFISWVLLVDRYGAQVCCCEVSDQLIGNTWSPYL